MDIHQLKVFISVYKNKSFSKAAKEVFLTQPTVSEHIKILEEDLGCKLFDRIGKTVIPTKEAEILYGYAVDIANKIDNLKDAVQRIKSKPAGNLLVGASSIPGTYILPRLISSFKNTYPNISVQVDISDSKQVIENLVSGKFLIGIVGTIINNSKIDYVPFMNDELVIISPNFIHETDIEPEKILKFPFIIREEGSGTRKEMENLLNELGIDTHDLQIVCTLSSTDAVKQAVKSGLGISILSIHAVKDEINCNNLKILKIKDFEMKRYFYIAYHRKRTLPFIYKLFQEFLKEKSFSL
jgi:DNA-binding transcriptional LysR family regulator